MAELGLPTDVGSPSPQEIINDDVAEGRSTLDLELTGSTTNGRRDDLHTEAIKQQSPGPPKPERRSCEIILAQGKAIDEDAIRKRGLAVIVPPVQQCWEYMVFEDGIEVEEILEEYDDAGLIEYLVQFADGREDVVSRHMWFSP